MRPRCGRKRCGPERGCLNLGFDPSIRTLPRYHLARTFGVADTTVRNYLDLLTDMEPV